MAPVIHRMSHTVHSLSINDNLMMLVHSTPSTGSRIIALYLRKQNFVPPDLPADARNAVRKWIGGFEYARAHRKPQAWFDDILEHLAPPLPLELDPDYPPYKGAFTHVGTSTVNVPGQLPGPRGASAAHAEKLEEPARRSR